MTVGEGQILTEDSLPSYLLDRADEIGVFGRDARWKARALQGGNVNFAFCVTDESDPSAKPLFVKQAPEFVAIFGPNGFPLTSERMQMEIDVYNEYKTLLGPTLASQYLPHIYCFDRSSMVTVMQFLDNYELLDHVLVQPRGTLLPSSSLAILTRGLGEFMGIAHAKTHSSKVSSERSAYLTQHFENRPMRDIQLEFVYTKCFRDTTPEQREGLHFNDAFQKEVDLLKAQYNGDVDHDNLVLSHGDLHPGSVMIHTNGDVKVIDPEFTVYGPPGLDVGSLLSGFVLAAIHQAFSQKPEAVTAIGDAAEAIWESYRRTMTEHGITSEQLHRIEIQTVGFTVIEVCRTALECAGGRLWLQFDDAQIKAKSRKAALTLVNNCMIPRHTGGISLLFQELKRLKQ